LFVGSCCEFGKFLLYLLSIFCKTAVAGDGECTAQLAKLSDLVAELKECCPQCTVESKPKDCDDIVHTNGNDGVYTVYLDRKPRQYPLKVYCDMTADKRGWTVGIKTYNPKILLQWQEKPLSCQMFVTCIVTLKKCLVHDSGPCFYIAELQPILSSKTTTWLPRQHGSVWSKFQWHC